MYSIYQKLLDEKGLKNADVARATNISNMTLSDWKNGRSTPKQDKLLKIAEYLDVTLEYLMTGKEPNFDVIYTEDTADFLTEVTKMARDADFKKRIRKYMQLMSDNQKSVDDMIDFLYAKEHPGED